MKEKLIIWGASSHALVVADIIRATGQYEIVGFLDDLHPERSNEVFCGSSILGRREQLDVLVERGVHHLCFGLGDNLARLELTEVARAKGFQLASAIHPSASVAGDVIVGQGTVISPQGSINPAVRIGENVFLQSSVTIGHESTIEDGAMLGSGAHLGGQVHVGRAARLEMGTIVGKGVRIGAGSVVGVGSIVLRDLPDGVLAYGAPARVIRELVDG